MSRCRWMYLSWPMLVVYIKHSSKSNRTGKYQYRSYQYLLVWPETSTWTWQFRPLLSNLFFSFFLISRTCCWQPKQLTVDLPSLLYSPPPPPLQPSLFPSLLFSLNSTDWYIGILCVSTPVCIRPILVWSGISVLNQDLKPWYQLIKDFNFNHTNGCRLAFTSPMTNQHMNMLILPNSIPH